MVILTAAGHGGPDPGAVNPYNPGRPEKVITLEIDAEFFRIAAANGHQVHRMRTGDTRLNLDAITYTARSVGARAVLEFHVNAEIPEAEGVTALCLPPSVAEHSASLAARIVRRVSEATGMQPLPLQYRTWSRFEELRDRLQVLSESGFITNVRDEALLRHPGVISTIAFAHLVALHEQEGLPPPVMPSGARERSPGLALAAAGAGLLVGSLALHRRWRA